MKLSRFPGPRLHCHCSWLTIRICPTRLSGPGGGLGPVPDDLQHPVRAIARLSSVLSWPRIGSAMAKNIIQMKDKEKISSNPKKAAEDHISEWSD